MSPEQWAVVRPALSRARELNPEEQCRYLEGLRQSDPWLAAEVESRLGREGTDSRGDSPGIATASVADRPAVGALETVDGHTSPHEGTDASHTPASPNSGAPTTRGRYEILAELGRGGMGVVYQARHTRTGRVVALKTMRLSGGRALELFKGEFRYLQGVSHPHLVQLHSLEADGERWLLTMEYVEGTDLRTHLLGEDHALPTRSMVSIPQADLTRSFEPPPSMLTASFENFPGATLTRDYAHVPRRAGNPAANLDQLRSVFGQLAEGVAALHAHRRVHRDLKPANVRVDTTGRVVVLDFGLTAALDHAGEYLASALAGTAPYLAPEQGDSPPVVSPASDWYAVGVMLYEALTGQFPFAGGLRQTLADKRRGVRVRPSHLRPDVPTDLEELCLALLSPNPAARPAAAAVLAAFGRQAPPVVATGAGETRLLGRDRQLEALRWAWADGRGGRAVVVRLSGPSGVGKSALVEHFAGELRGTGAVVLSGRCYEHESVPYKALDPIVDELARHLHAAAGTDVESLAPEHAAALLRVFPVLERVSPLFDRAAGGRLSPDPQEVRRQAFAGLRELLGQLAASTPLVVHIDDLQWGDIDSAYLLSDLLRPPAAPAVVWLLAHRSEDAASPCLTTLWESLARVGAGVREVAVGPLTEAESRLLALSLLGPEREAQADQVAREAGGNPFFVAELARAAAAGVGVAGEELTLDGLIRSRVAKLPAGERRLLEVVAVSGRPLTDLDAYRASGDEGGDPRGHFARLEAASLLRGVGEAGAIELETYHDRVREAVLAGLGADERQGHHGRLAAVLEDSGRGDLEELAIHFEGARERTKAGEYYHRAGDKSSRSMAFDQAAGFYAKALDLLELTPQAAVELRTKLAQALANAGRCEESGPVYLAAAAGTDGLKNLDLRRQAMEQLLMSFETDLGFQTFRELLRITGYRWPSGPRRAFFWTVLELVRMRLRGISYSEKPVDAVPPEKLWELDVIYSGGCRTGHLDMTVGTGLMARAARLSLNLGEPQRVVRSLCCGAMMISWGGGRTRKLVEKWLGKACELVEKLNDPYWTAYYRMKWGLTHWAYGEWRQNVDAMTTVTEICNREQTSLIFFRTEVRFTLLHSLLMSGRWKEYGIRVDEFREDAVRLGNRYATYAMQAKSYLQSLMRGNPDQATNDLQAAHAAWQHRANFLGDFQRVVGRVEVSLYSGNSAAAHVILSDEDKGTVELILRQARFMEVTYLLLEQTFGRVKLALAGHAPADNRLFAKRSRLLRGVTRHASTIEQRDMPWSNPLAKLLRAGVANLRGDTATALATLSEAAAEFDSADMLMYAAAARRQRGGLIGGTEGRALIHQADEFMTGEGVVEPDRIAAMLAPGFDSEVIQ